MNTTTPERTAPATILEALHNVVTELEREQQTLTWPAETTYTTLMAACYGPLLLWDQDKQRYEFQGSRSQPAGALQAARALTSKVVDELGAEHGSTIADVQSAIRRLTKA